MQKPRNCFTALLLILMLPLSVTAASTEEKIQPLSNYIVAADCSFIRNDTGYTASEARDHIQRKSNYAGRFSSGITRKSGMSANRYQLRCQNQLPDCDNWPKQQLQHYRTASSKFFLIEHVCRLRSKYNCCEFEIS